MFSDDSEDDMVAIALILILEDEEQQQQQQYESSARDECVMEFTKYLALMESVERRQPPCIGPGRGRYLRNLGHRFNAKDVYEETWAIGRDDGFRSRVRFTKSQFDELHDEVQRYIGEPRELLRLSANGEPTRSRKCKIDTKNRLMCCLMYLAHYSTTSELKLTFGWSKKSINDDFWHIIGIILAHLSYEIAWPNADYRNELSQSMAPYITGLIGFIDGVHTPIFRPDLAQDAYFSDKKKRHTIVHQAIVGLDGRFIHVFAGRNGNSHDSMTLRESPIFLRSREFFSPGQFLIGDKAYRAHFFHDFIITPLLGHGQLEGEQIEAIVHAFRVIVEWGFGLMKNLWTITRNDFRNRRTRSAMIVHCCSLLTNRYMRVNDVSNAPNQIKTIIERVILGED